LPCIEGKDLSIIPFGDRNDFLLLAGNKEKKGKNKKKGIAEK